jgi:exodeoxyribonuclease-3
MKIVSWNVNGIRACYKKGITDFIEAEEPDILCLQETKAHIDQCEEAIQKLGYDHAYWSSAVKKGYSGVATFLLKEPVGFSKSVISPAYESEGRIMLTEHEKFDLYNIYFPNGGSGEERHNFKQKFLKELNAYLKTQIKKGKEIVVVGDYNVAHKDIDVHDPVRLSKHSGFLPEEREWFAQFLELGFIDTFRQFKPDEKDRYSWWDMRTISRPSNRGWRIDYICITNGLKKYLQSADILDEVYGSDHCPVVMELDI